MTEVKHTEDVGAPDPELNTSPIAEENSDETEVLHQEEPGEPVCYFNNKSFPTGAYIKSGTSILKCDYASGYRRALLILTTLRRHNSIKGGN